MQYFDYKFFGSNNRQTSCNYTKTVIINYTLDKEPAFFVIRESSNM